MSNEASPNPALANCVIILCKRSRDCFHCGSKSWAVNTDGGGGRGSLVLMETSTWTDEILLESTAAGRTGTSWGAGGDLPSRVSTESCRPRLCRGLTTQWLLVAVMSNTSQPSSEAQRVRLSSRNRSDSLQERRETQAPGQQVMARSPPPASQPATDGQEDLVRQGSWQEVCQSPQSGFIRPRSSHGDPQVAAVVGRQSAEEV